MARSARDPRWLGAIDRLPSALTSRSARASDEQDAVLVAGERVAVQHASAAVVHSHDVQTFTIVVKLRADLRAVGNPQQKDGIALVRRRPNA